MRSSLLTMSAGASTDQEHFGAAAAPSAVVVAPGAAMGSVTIPAVLHPPHTGPIYAKCPHHAGQCPACHEPVLDAKPPASKLSAQLQALAPEDVKGQLDELIRLADKDGRREMVVGAGQALFARLKALLPEEVIDPQPKRLSGSAAVAEFFREIGRAFGGVPTPKVETDAQAVLKRAMEKHWITQACLDRAKGLPLDGKVKAPLSKEDQARFAAFLPLLAEQVYADKRRPREG